MRAIRGIPSVVVVVVVVSRLAAVAAIAAMAFGCGTSKKSQLEAIAKDWSAVIRASQVVPVYPLTEDIQPGDVFLVQLPIERQQELYEEAGYLALDQHAARIQPRGYSGFYALSFPQGVDWDDLPRDFLRPPAGEEGAAAAAWEKAPHAAFPSYSFSVRRGGGLNLAVPVSGVPVGLSLLGAEEANGTITIGAARTLGVDQNSLYRQVHDWARRNRDFLRDFAPSEGRSNYLRVVSRIYVTGDLDVTLADATRVAAGADAGVPRPVEFLSARSPERPGDTRDVTIEDYLSNIEKLNASLEAASLARTLESGARELLPGGSLRVTAASSRSITLKERFDPPLVLGYLGFDCAILEGGRIGPAVPTRAVLEPEQAGASILRASGASAIYSASVSLDVYRALRAMGEAAEPHVAALDALARHVPSETLHYAFGREGLVIERNVAAQTLRPPGSDPFVDYRTYRGLVEQSARALGRALAKPSFSLKRKDGATVTVDEGSDVRAELERALAGFRKVLDDPAVATEAAEAEAAALAYYSAEFEE